MAPSRAPQDEARLPLEARVRAEAIRQMAWVLRGSWIALPLLALAALLGMWRSADHRLLFPWFACAVAVPVARALLVRWFLTEARGPAVAVRWARWITWVAFADGVLWGVGANLFFTPGSVAEQVLVVAALVVIVAGSIFVSSFWPPTLYAYGIPALGLAAIPFAREGTAASLGMAGALVLLQLVLHGMLQAAARLTREAIALRFENQELVEQLRVQKQAADDANVAKSRFLAAASHDLRQPLHAMTLLADALGGRLPDSDDRRMLARLQDSLASMGALFNALLDGARLDAGIVEPRVRDVRLSPLLDRLRAELAGPAEAKGLAWRCPPTPLVVRSDPALLETMLRNLIGNAVRYTDRGYVAIACGEADGEVRIDVEDSGVGIPPDRHAEVFREFRQLRDPSRDEAEGLGLGLAIVERLAGLLGHRIELRSAPGEGSCFSLLLPASAADARVDEDGAREPAPPDGDLAGMVVLVVDDHAAVREGMQALLARWGCEPIVADSDEAAVAAARAAPRPPELIVADHRLREGRSGSQAIERVRRALGAATPALIVTGDTAPARLREAQASGHPVMSKPVAPARLRAFLRAVRRGRATA